MRLKFIKYIVFSIFGKKKLGIEQRSLKLTQIGWDKIEKEFLKHLNSYFSEINGSIQNLRNNADSPFIKSQLCLAFTGADTFARFYLIFEGQRENLNSNNERRFKKWLNTFVFTNENNIYQLHKEKIKYDAVGAWRLRNALLHFYSFPEPENGCRGQLMCYLPDLLRQKMENFFKEKGHKIILNDACYFIDAILNGFLIQLQYFKKMIENSPNQYIDAVLFAHKIMMRDGSYTVKLDIKNMELKKYS